MKGRLGLAALLVGAHFVFRGLGFGAHASVIAGMPQNEASWVIGPVYVVSWMALVTLVPILILGEIIRVSGEKLFPTK